MDELIHSLTQDEIQATPSKVAPFLRGVAS
jgi:hypothetical protein